MARLSRLTSRLGRLARVCGAAAAADPYLASDTFDRADSASLGNTDGGSLGALAWTETNAAAFAIASNKLAQAVAAEIAWIDVSTGNVVVAASITLEANGDRGVVARFSDANNYILAYINSQGTDALTIYSKETGSLTQRAQTNVTLTPATYALALTCNGTAISATVDGANEITWSSSFNQAATKVGVYSGNNEFTSTVDNFTVAAP